MERNKTGVGNSMRAGAMFEQAVATDMEKQGWTVFNTNYGFPDLFCVKDGRIKFVECKDGNDRLREHQRKTIEHLKNIGLNAVVIKSYSFVPNLNNDITPLRRSVKSKRHRSFTDTVGEPDFITTKDELIANMKKGGQIKGFDTDIEILVDMQVLKPIANDQYAFYMPKSNRKAKK